MHSDRKAEIRLPVFFKTETEYNLADFFLFCV